MIGDCLEALRIVALLASPVIPNAAAELWRRLGLPGRPEDARLPEAAAWGQLPAGAHVEKGEPLFPRKDVEWPDGRGSTPTATCSWRAATSTSRGPRTRPAWSGWCASAPISRRRRRRSTLRRPARRRVRGGRVASARRVEARRGVGRCSKPLAVCDDVHRRRRMRLRPVLRAFAARRAGDRVPVADPAREAHRQAARDPLARRVGRHVPRARRRRRARAHDLPLLHRRARRSARPRSSAGATCRSAASCRSRTPTSCGPRPRITPADRVLVETDSPFLTPEPYRGKRERARVRRRGRRGAGAGARRSTEEIAAVTRANAARVFGVDR